MDKNQEKSINKALAGLEKRFGEKIVMRMGDSSNDIDTIPSGRADLDAALGGGYGSGKIVEIFAESGCGKTGLVLEAIAAVQKAGGVAAIVDAEQALNTEYCAQVGVDIDNLYISQPDTGEQAYEIIRALTETGEFDLIAVDSVAAMVPRRELEGESGEAMMGVSAKMHNQGCRMLTGPCAKSGTTVIFINQLRQTMAMYGPSTTTTGGKGLKFTASQRLEVKNKGQIKQGEDVIGFKQEVKIVKNKLGVPFKKIENDILFGIGVDKLTGLITTAVDKGILDRRGAFYYYDEVKIARGAKELRTALEDNPELLDEIENRLKA